MTYNQVLDFFTEVANAHKFIKSFGIGAREDTASNLEKDLDYPHLYMSPISDSVDENVNRFRFNFVVCDLVSANEDNLQEVLSDTNRICKDIIKICRYDETRINILETPTLNAFKDRFADVTAGWTFELDIEVDFPNNYCDIPSDFFGTGGTGCEPVTILDDIGNIIATIQAGGTYTCSEGGACVDASVTNSNATYNASVASGATLSLPDTTYDIYVNGVLNATTTLPTLDNLQDINITA